MDSAFFYWFFVPLRHEGKAKMILLYSVFVDVRINLRRLYLGLLGRSFSIHPVDVLTKTHIAIGMGDGLHTVFYLEQLRMHMNKKVPDTGYTIKGTMNRPINEG